MISPPGNAVDNGSAIRGFKHCGPVTRTHTDDSAGIHTSHLPATRAIPRIVEFFTLVADTTDWKVDLAPAYFKKFSILPRTFIPSNAGVNAFLCLVSSSIESFTTRTNTFEIVSVDMPMVISMIPLYGISKPYAPFNLSQFKSVGCKSGKWLRSHDSVTVLTSLLTDHVVDRHTSPPIQRRHATSPISTSHST